MALRMEQKAIQKGMVEVVKLAGMELAGNFGDKERAAILIKRQGNESSIRMDREIENLISKELRKRGVLVNLLSEESGRMIVSCGLDYLICIDPICGSMNYRSGSPYFCVSMALLKNYEPVFGVVHSPMTSETFTAAIGKGAKLNGQKIHSGAGRLIALDNAHLFPNFIFEEATARNPKFSVVAPWSVALNLCYVASGRYAASLSSNSMPWDFAAGMLVAMEAGAKVTDQNGSRISFEDMILTDPYVAHGHLMRTPNEKFRDYTVIAAQKKINSKLLRALIRDITEINVGNANLYKTEIGILDDGKDIWMTR